MTRRRVETGPDRSVDTPRADRRARLYKLEDNGASDLARRKRAARNAIYSARAAIEGIMDRQNNMLPLPPRSPYVAGKMIARYEEIIVINQEIIAQAEAAAPLIAPVTRRVAREDRRRRRAAKRNKTNQEKP